MSLCILRAVDLAKTLAQLASVEPFAGAPAIVQRQRIIGREFLAALGAQEACEECWLARFRRPISCSKAKLLWCPLLRRVLFDAVDLVRDQARLSRIRLVADEGLGVRVTRPMILQMVARHETLVSPLAPVTKSPARASSDGASSATLGS